MITIDTTEFDKTLNEYVATVPGDLEEILNRKMFFILKGAYDRTPEADKGAIERGLMVDSHSVSMSAKTGRYKKRKANFANSAAVFRIIQAARRRAGLKGLYGKSLGKAARALLGSRSRAVGTLRRGWTRPMDTFAKAARMSSPSSPGNVRGRGGGNAATPSFDPVAEAWYDVNINARSRSKLVYNPNASTNPRIDPRVEAAFSAAFDREEQSMREYIERKLQERMDKINP
jgi:hypothetical protein